MKHRLPHAILFHGQKGIGKLDFVRAFAQALLCVAPVDGDGQACGNCSSCRWFAESSHPDFRLLRPANLETGDADTEESGADIEDAGTNQNDPGEKKSRKAPSKEIRIEQVRALASFLNVGTHRGGRRIVLLYPLETMNAYTANALLKMLEEPPAQTVFLLIAESLDRIMPTLLSRCRRVALASPDRAQAQAWLLQQQHFPPDLMESALAETGGAPLAALSMLENAGQAKEFADIRSCLLNYLAKPQGENPLAIAELISKEYLTLATGWLQRWIFDCLSYALAQGIRYYPNRQQQIATLVGDMDKPGVISKLLAYDKQLQLARKIVEHPLHAKLFIESLLLNYAEIFVKPC